MAEYKTSKISKSKILEACKELFYLKGYTNTTYNDICVKADSNPGLINYYFKTKKNIAGMIYGDFFLQIKDKVKKFMLGTYGFYDLQYGTTLEHRIFKYLCKKDENINIFYYEISIEGIEYDLPILYEFFKLHVDEYHLNISEDYTKLIQTATIASGIGITKRSVEGYFNIDGDTLFDFRQNAMYNAMGIPKERIDEILRVTYDMFLKLQIELEDYFMIHITPKE
ncbi:MAG: TetR family transcriptional regulator [Eubacteriales bacterium]